MEAQQIIAKRIARELRSGMLVNLGIGIPTLVANYLPADVRVLSIRERFNWNGPHSGGRDGAPYPYGCGRQASDCAAWRLHVRQLRFLWAHSGRSRRYDCRSISGDSWPTG